MGTTTWKGCALLALLVALAAPAPGCAATAKEVKTARTSAYDTEFANVFSQTLIAVRERYPKLIENPSAGWIKTSWHPVRVAGQRQRSQVPQGQGQVRPGIASGQNTAQYTSYFVRFRIYVLGGKPWRVRIESEASEIEPGGVPAPLRGAETPGWLQGRTDALRVAIHDRLERHAVKYNPRRDSAPVKTVEKKPEKGRFGDIPAGAEAHIDEVLAAALVNDLGSLRLLMAEDFVWSLGAEPSADQALVMFQADDSRMSLLISAIKGGCNVFDDGARVACPADYDPATAQAYTGYWVEFAPVDSAWKMTAFTSNQ